MSGGNDSTKKKRKARTALSQLASHLQGPNDELHELLYQNTSPADINKLKALLKKVGEKEALSKSQVTRSIERCLKGKKLTMNQVRKALGKPEKDDEDYEEEEEEAEAATKKPAAKKAKTTAKGAGGQDGGRRESGFFGSIVDTITSIFSPSKK